jgi:hypothetical protein
MTDPGRPLPLQDVYAIVERRRRRRARTRAIVAPAAAVGAAGVAALVVVAVQAGGNQPAPAGAPPAALATSPATATTEPTTGAPTPAPRTTTPRPTAPPFSPGWLSADLLPGLASSLFDRPDAEQTRLLDEAATLASAWGVPMYPAAKAVVAKADALGTRIDPTDRTGAEKLINRFEAAGYTEDYAAELARAWDTDPRTAEIVGALVLEAGCCDG